MRKFLFLVVAWSLSLGAAQDATQKAIGEKARGALGDGVSIVCPPTAYVTPGDSGAVCIRSNLTTREAKTALSQAFGAQLSNPPGWGELGGSFLNAWNTGQFLHPVRVYPLGPFSVFVIYKAGAPTGAHASAARVPFPSAARAIAAGGTRGAAYVPLADLQDLVTIRYVAPRYEITLNDQTLVFRARERKATLNGQPVALPGAPFVVDGRTYLPAGLLRLLGCQVQNVPSESGALSALDVVCQSQGETVDDVLPRWVF